MLQTWRATSIQRAKNLPGPTPSSRGQRTVSFHSSLWLINYCVMSGYNGCRRQMGCLSVLNGPVYWFLQEVHGIKALLEIISLKHRCSWTDGDKQKLYTVIIFLMQSFLWYKNRKYFWSSRQILSNYSILNPISVWRATLPVRVSACFLSELKPNFYVFGNTLIVLPHV